MTHATTAAPREGPDSGYTSFSTAPPPPPPTRTPLRVTLAEPQRQPPPPPDPQAEPQTMATPRSTGPPVNATTHIPLLHPLMLSCLSHRDWTPTTHSLLGTTDRPYFCVFSTCKSLGVKFNKNPPFSVTNLSLVRRPQPFAMHVGSCWLCVNQFSRTHSCV